MSAASSGAFARAKSERPAWAAPIHLLGQTQAVDALDHLEEVNRIAGLVGLQMADHVPAQPRQTERNLRLGFLDLVLAEDIEPQTRGGAHHLGRLALRHGYKRHLGRLPPGPAARLCNPLLHLPQSLREFHAGEGKKP